MASDGPAEVGREILRNILCCKVPGIACCTVEYEVVLAGSWLGQVWNVEIVVGDGCLNTPYQSNMRGVSFLWWDGSYVGLKY